MRSDLRLLTKYKTLLFIIKILMFFALLWWSVGATCTLYFALSHLLSKR